MSNPYNKIHNLVIERIDFPKFYAASGCKILTDPDSDGFFQATSPFAAKTIAIRVSTGDWHFVENPSEKFGLYGFVKRYHDIPEDGGENVRCLEILAEHCGLEDEFKAVNQDEIQRFIHNCRLNMAALRHSELKMLTGIRSDVAEFHSIGYARRGIVDDQGGWIVPIPDPDGSIRSLRFVGKNLKSQWAKHGKKSSMDRSPKLFGAHAIREDDKTIVLCELELDRLIIWQERRRRDITAVSLTGLNYKREWNKHFDGKHVVICMSVTKEASAYAQNVIAPRIQQDVEAGSIKSLRVITLPLSGLDEDRNFCDWMRQSGGWDQFENLIQQAPVWVAPNRNEAPVEPKKLRSFAEIDDPANVDVRVEVPLAITGETSVVYDSTAAFRVSHCNEIKADRCDLCVNKVFEIGPGRAEHISSCNAGEWEREHVQQRICCPFNKKPGVETLQKYTFREVIAMGYRARVVDRASNEARLELPAAERTIYIRIPDGEPKPLEPRGYTAVGWVRTNPKTSHRTMLVESLTPIEECHESYDVEKARPALEKIKKLGWTGIVRDLTKHRTRIFGQDEVLILVLLTYCSQLQLQFNGELIRGWINSVILGDSGVGKSRVFETVSAMIGVGDIFQCSTGKRTGLSYSIIQNRAKWVCQAGIYPCNSRKILCVEEAQKMANGEIDSIAVAMDSGFMDVKAVARGEYETRTRLVMLCNPPDGRTLSSYLHGCEAMRDLFLPMFIRRVDCAAFIRASDKLDEFNRRHVPDSTPAIEADDLRQLILWAWTRKSEQVVFQDEATNKILEASKDLSRRFGQCADIPLICPSDVRKTLARISSAWAALDVSTDDFKSILVFPRHADAAVDFLTKLYSNKDCALDSYSAISRRRTGLDDFPLILKEFEKRIARKSEGVAFAKILAALARGQAFRAQELATLGDCSNENANDVVMFLNRYSMASKHADERIVATPKFGRALKKLEQDRPEIWALVNVGGTGLEEAS